MYFYDFFYCCVFRHYFIKELVIENNFDEGGLLTLSFIF